MDAREDFDVDDQRNMTAMTESDSATYRTCEPVPPFVARSNLRRCTGYGLPTLLLVYGVLGPSGEEYHPYLYCIYGGE